MSDKKSVVDLAETNNEELAAHLRELSLAELPGFLEMLNEQLDTEFVLVVSESHPGGTFTLVEVDEESIDEDGMLPVPVRYDSDSALEIEPE